MLQVRSDWFAAHPNVEQALRRIIERVDITDRHPLDVADGLAALLETWRPH